MASKHNSINNKKKESLRRILLGKKLQAQMANGEVPDIGQAMRELGYSEGTIEKNKAKMLDSDEVRESITEFVGKLDTLIDNSIEDAEKKRKKASFRDNIVAISEMTKTKRLVEGKSTENKAVNISSILDSLEGSEEKA